MKKTSIDAPLLALSGVILLAGGMFITSSIKQIGTIYQTVAQDVPAASQLAQAGGGSSSGGDVSGWAWSANTGWISFNSANEGAGGGTYKVSISTTTANPDLAKFDGYAWSSNVGWISFQGGNDVTGCPADAAVTPLDGCNPAMDLATGAVTGYARVLSMKNESGDGWLQLSGTNHVSGSGGITFNPTTKAITGFAWEPTSVGWIEFDAKLEGSTLVPTPTFAASCSASPNPVNPGGTVTFTANTTGNTGPYSYDWSEPSCGNASACAITYSAAGSGPALKVTDSAGTDKNPTCPNITVSSVATDLSLFIGSNVSTTKTSHSLRQGNIFALRWENNLAEYESCSLSIDNNGGTYWSNAIASDFMSNGSIAGLPTAVSSGVQRGTYTFTLTCHDTEALLPSKSANATLRIVGASGEEF